VTSKEFFDVLGRLKGWEMTNGGKIRRLVHRVVQCPVSAVANYVCHTGQYQPCDYLEAGRKLKMKHITVARIANASDATIAYCDKIRKRLLKATRLSS